MNTWSCSVFNSITNVTEVISKESKLTTYFCKKYKIFYMCTGLEFAKELIRTWNKLLLYKEHTDYTACKLSWWYWEVRVKHTDLTLYIFQVYLCLSHCYESNVHKSQMFGYETLFFLVGGWVIGKKPQTKYITRITVLGDEMPCTLVAGYQVWRNLLSPSCG